MPAEKLEKAIAELERNNSATGWFRRGVSLSPEMLRAVRVMFNALDNMRLNEHPHSAASELSWAAIKAAAEELK